MPLPEDPEVQKQIFDFIAKGDPAASEYLALIAELVYLADDSVDEELDFDTRQQFMMRILEITMVKLPFNAFFVRMNTHLAPLILDILVHWQKADDWKRNGDLKRKLFAFVRRENIDSLVVAVAGIMGGIEHAKDVTERIMTMCHVNSETFEEWCAEGKP